MGDAIPLPRDGDDRTRRIGDDRMHAMQRFHDRTARDDDVERELLHAPVCGLGRTRKITPHRTQLGYRRAVSRMPTSTTAPPARVAGAGTSRIPGSMAAMIVAPTGSPSSVRFTR
jgi:hypothetical protein